ncbi:MAG: endonuclease domain-containing protein, partial [Saprospiraceae bacterium]|nr:endonuclease domain-containing protein [Saprospiraceae bacterium]
PASSQPQPSPSSPLESGHDPQTSATRRGTERVVQKQYQKRGIFAHTTQTAPMHPNRRIHNRPGLILKRKQLRNNATPEEVLLWQELKGRRLAGRKFRRQHSIMMWIADFYCPSEKLVIELDGAYHYTRQQRLADHYRDQAFTDELGIRVLRFPNHRVRNDLEGVLAEIKQHFRK